MFRATHVVLLRVKGWREYCELPQNCCYRKAFNLCLVACQAPALHHEGVLIGRRE